MALDNDTRGWIMTCVSGVACVFGASIICVDLIVQRIPGKQHWRIQDSNGFLAASLSLSFGVMLFSSLNNMLPEAEEYLDKGLNSKAAARWTWIACFLGGVVGIQFFSRFLHHHIPSDIVDCDHTHEGDEDDGHDHDKSTVVDNHRPHGHGYAVESTPLLSHSDPYSEPDLEQQMMSNEPYEPRASLPPKLTSRMTSFITGAKSACNEGDPCYGYSDPCGDECLKIASRSPTRAYGQSMNPTSYRQPSLLRTATTGRVRPRPTHTQTLGNGTAQTALRGGYLPRPSTGQSQNSTMAIYRGRERTRGHSSSQFDTELPEDGFRNGNKRDESTASSTESGTALDASHHHHVPSNAFLAIGLQTSIAIALHKLPEGFITYATNHANPKLGFSVFMALFIHNITEGFAMALPLYLAINNRLQAMLWSSLLGGVSQPLGAGVAALWFKLAGTGGWKPGDTVYGCMFSVTAGIMASVALQLFQESLTLTHNRNICTIFAFIGMGILGASYALTA